VTHDQEEAMTMSDRIAVMNKGHYEQLGDPESLYERPQTHFVAGFLGTSNLLRGTIEGTAGAYVVMRLSDDTRIRVPGVGGGGTGAFEAGVRPEKIRLLNPDDDGPAGLNTLLGTIRDVSYLGVSTSYGVDTRDGTRLTVHEQNVGPTSRERLLMPGHAIRLSWSPDHTFVVPTLEGGS
jgi:spermidine/putrescine transport system ATP-binding protein